MSTSKYEEEEQIEEDEPNDERASNAKKVNILFFSYLDTVEELFCVIFNELKNTFDYRQETHPTRPIHKRLPPSQPKKKLVAAWLGLEIRHGGLLSLSGRSLKCPALKNPTPCQLKVLPEIQAPTITLISVQRELLTISTPNSSSTSNFFCVNGTTN